MNLIVNLNLLKKVNYGDNFKEIMSLFYVDSGLQNRRLGVRIPPLLPHPPLKYLVQSAFTNINFLKSLLLIVINRSERIFKVDSIVDLIFLVQHSKSCEVEKKKRTNGVVSKISLFFQLAFINLSVVRDDPIQYYVSTAHLIVLRACLN